MPYAILQTARTASLSRWTIGERYYNDQASKENAPMTFMITYKILPAHRDAAQQRFKQGGGLPPEGVKMIGRRHKADGSGGFTLCESDDVVALAKWTQDWSDLLEFETSPVLDDKQFGIVLGA
jgi:hypothetical protein